MILYRQILIITVISLFSGRAAHAENALHKSFQLLRGVLDNQQSISNDGSEVNSQNLYWNYKADFLADVSKGKMADYDHVYGDKEKSLVLNSVRAILANDYQTKVPEGERSCEVAFEVNVDELLKVDLVNKMDKHPLIRLHSLYIL